MPLLYGHTCEQESGKQNSQNKCETRTFVSIRQKSDNLIIVFGRGLSPCLCPELKSCRYFCWHSHSQTFSGHNSSIAVYCGLVKLTKYSLRFDGLKFNHFFCSLHSLCVIQQQFLLCLQSALRWQRDIRGIFNRKDRNWNWILCELAHTLTLMPTDRKR